MLTFYYYHYYYIIIIIITIIYLFIYLIYLFTNLFILLLIYILTYYVFVSMTTEDKAPYFSFFVQLCMYVCPQYFHQSSPIIFSFIFSSFHWGRTEDIDFERLGLPLPIHCMGKPFKVSTNYFVFSCFVVLFCKGQPFVSVCFLSCP